MNVWQPLAVLDYQPLCNSPKHPAGQEQHWIPFLRSAHV